MLKQVEDEVPFNRRMWQWRLCAALVILVGVWIFVILGLYVAQVHLISDLDSRVYFSEVVDQMDKDASDLSYDMFVTESEELRNAQIWSFYVFDVRNPISSIEEGQKPYIEEQGPYAYRRVTGKWDVSFDELSHEVSYSQWSYLDPVDPITCDMLHFRLNVPDYANLCANEGCYCRDDAETVSVFNIHYLSAVMRYGTDGIIAILSQKLFQAHHELLLGAFLEYCNLAAMPVTVRNVMDYQQDLATLRVIGSAIEHMRETYGADQMISAFHGGQEDEVVLDCGPFNWEGRSHCDWVTSELVTDIVRERLLNDTMFLSYGQTANLLNTSINGSIAFEHVGYPLWARAARYLGYLAHSVDRADDVAAFDALSDTLCRWLGQPAPDKLYRSMCDMHVEAVAQWIYLPRYGWRTRTVVNDDLIALITAATVDTLPCDEYGAMCAWEVNSWLGGNISLGLGTALYQRGGTDGASLSTYESIAQLHVAKRYCDLEPERGDAALNCTKMQTARTLALETLPAVLAGHDGLPDGPTTDEELRYYRNMTCAVTRFMGNFYNHTFAKTRLVRYVNEGYTGPEYTFTADNLEDLAYGQWAGGYTTTALDQAPSAYNAALFLETYYVSEFYAQALMAGYADMRLSVPEGRALLQALANDTAEGRAFNKKIMRKQSTFYGDGSTILSGLGYEGDVGFMEENVYADFEDDVLNGEFNSSLAQCEALQQAFEDCSDNAEGRLENCKVWETSSTSPRTGIKCDETYVLDDLHPYALKRGNLVARMMFNFTTNYMLKERKMWCADPDRCDYLRGGLFVESTVRNVLFDGYVDPIAALLQADELQRDRNITMGCLRPQTLEPWFDCEPMGLDFKCVEDGFTLSRGDEQLIAVDRSSVNRELWYTQDIVLDAINETVQNPVFAHMPGLLWQNVTFQKARSCNGYESCQMRSHTGRNALSRRGQLLQFNGNSSLSFAGSSLPPVPVGGNPRFEAAPQLFQGYSIEGVSDIRAFWTEAGTPVRLRLIPRTDTDILSRVIWYLPNDRHYTLPDIISIPIGRFEVVLEDFEAENAAMDPDLRDWNGVPLGLPAGLRYAVNRGTYAVPGFVGAPHHYWNEKAGGDEYFQVQGLVGDREFHELHMDVEPVTGVPMRFVERTQWSFRFEINALYPILNTFQGRCTSPGRDDQGRVGCGMFSPVYWVQKARVIDPIDAKAFQDEILWRLVFMDYTFYAATGLCGACGVCGALLLLRVALSERARRNLILAHERLRLQKIAKEKAAALAALEGTDGPGAKEPEKEAAEEES